LNDEKIVHQLRFTLMEINARPRAGHFYFGEVIK